MAANKKKGWMKDNKKWLVISIVIALILVVAGGVWMTRKKNGGAPVNPVNVVSQEKQADSLEGQWQDTHSQRAVMEIQDVGTNVYSVTITWAGSAFDDTMWTFSGSFDPNTGRLDYNNATEYYRNFENEDVVQEVRSQNGTGALIMEDGKLRWQDDVRGDSESLFEYVAPLLPPEPIKTVDGTPMTPPDGQPPAEEQFMGYTPSEIAQAELLIEAEIASFGEGFELHSLDPLPERNNQTELDYINSLERSEVPYTHVLVVGSSFHTPKEFAEFTAWEPDLEYTYEWYLGRHDNDDWEIVTYGY